MYRDALLLLAFQSPMKRTPLMYGLNVSWTMYKELEDELVQKKVVMRITTLGMTTKEMHRIGADSRNLYLLQITEKGKIVLRWLDAMLQYINDSTPGVMPPLWVLQSIFRRRSDFDPLQIEESYYLQVLPGKLGVGEAQLRAMFTVTTHRIFDKRKRRRGITMGIHCPECGRECANLHGIKIHVTKMHVDNREKILERILLYLQKKGLA